MIFVQYAGDGMASSPFDRIQRQLFSLLCAGGPKGAPPAIPPIIINPFTYRSPAPAIDPRVTPLNPPAAPPRPAMLLADLS
jgi:hypothetical protein